MGKWGWTGLIAAVLCSLGAYAWYELGRVPSGERPLGVSDARRLLESQQYAAALEAAERILRRRGP